MSEPDMTYTMAVITVVALVTIAIRFAPFVIFRKQTPDWVLYLGNVLPYAIMAMLVVYCLKDVSFFTGNHGVTEIISVGVVVGLHKWKHNTLLSIIAGTLCYMFLIQWGIFL
ncbi:MAG: AzlD domain-containing protein [Schaedlerella sp.]|nr:AzlD domain-containing protein [Schaedlerella sp.]